MMGVKGVGKEFLIVRLSSIGDVITALPVADAIKKHIPNSRVSWLVSPPASEILKLSKSVDNILLWDRRPFDKAVSSGHFIQTVKLLNEAKKLLSDYEFDVVLDIHSLFLTGILSKMAKSALKIGIDELSEGNSFFMTKTVENIKSPHKGLRYFNILSAININSEAEKPSVAIPKEKLQFAEDLLQSAGISTDKKIITVNLKTTWDNKHYPTELFLEVLEKIPQEAQLVFCGNKKDAPFIESVVKKLNRGVSIAGKTTITELAAVFTKATLLLTPDSGPLHIASLVGLKTISLWGPTEPAMYAPLFGENTFIVTPHSCSGCNKRSCKYKTNECMKKISPETILTAINQMVLK
ncbi:MAG: glycosyltransferase family 9 protein [Selenomonadaceae bacterium]|nr:glycosyltransferase family 9 protein [Selenomonadaceae bacterium]